VEIMGKIRIDHLYFYHTEDDIGNFWGCRVALYILMIRPTGPGVCAAASPGSGRKRRRKLPSVGKNSATAWAKQISRLDWAGIGKS
jgi:hypothetical protein